MSSQKTINAVLGATVAVCFMSISSPVLAGAVFEHGGGRGVVGIISLSDNETGAGESDDFITSEYASAFASIDGGSNITGSAEVHSTATSFGGSISIAGSNGRAQISLLTEPVRVSETTEILFEWNLADTSTSFPAGTFLGGAFIARPLRGLVEDLINVSGGTSGAEVLTLEAGVDYFFLAPRMTITLNEFGAYADLFVEITIIPAPSTAALLLPGVAVATRRRRRA